jgi:cytochrome c553
LVNLQQGRRNYPLMQNLLTPLDDAYLRTLADYFAGLEIPYSPPAPQPTDKALLARGLQLVRQGDPALQIPACMQCHGSALTGTQPSVPGLLGLPRDYLNAQLGGWKNGQRQAQAPDCMADIAKRLSDAEDADPEALRFPHVFRRDHLGVLAIGPGHDHWHGVALRARGHRGHPET